MACYAPSIFNVEGPCADLPSNGLHAMSFEGDFLSYNGPWRGNLCHIDTLLVISLVKNCRLFSSASFNGWHFVFNYNPLCSNALPLCSHLT